MGNHADKRGETCPSLWIEQPLRLNRVEKIDCLGDATGDYRDFFSDDIPPETHERINGRVHRQKVRVDHGDWYFSNVGACPAAESKEGPPIGAVAAAPWAAAAFEIAACAARARLSAGQIP